MEAKSEGLRVNVTPQLRAALELHAAKHDVPVAQVIRTAIRQYLLSIEKGEANNGD